MSTETPTLDRKREQLKSTKPDMTRIFLSIALNNKINFSTFVVITERNFAPIAKRSCF